MKRVVIVGADFAPSSLPPALRIRYFASHLAEHGWQPTVLTTDPRHYTWPVDPENEGLVPPSVRVIRTGALPARLTRRLGISDIGMRTMLQHWLALSKLCLRREVDLLFIPVPPYMPMLLGRLIHAQFGVPYVIDYIDPWVTDYYWKLPPAQRPPKWPLANALARLCEPLALRRVAQITGVSHGTTESVRARYPWLGAERATEIPYGGEPSDMAYVQASRRANPSFDRNDGLLHLSYTGAVIPSMHATVRALFQAVCLGRARLPALFGRLRMHFVGTSYAAGASEPQVLPLAREAGVEDLVEERPSRVAYLEALRILLDSHGLLVVGSEEPHYTASKLFPYILARKPLLVVFHEASSVVRIVRETEAATLVTYGPQRSPQTQVELILAGLEQILRNPDQPPPTRWEAFEPYTTSAMAARLAGVFTQALDQA